MCNLGEGIWQKGIAEGKLLGLIEGEEKTLLSSIKNLMDSLHLTVEQAMDALKISDSDREKYSSLILTEK